MTIRKSLVIFAILALFLITLIFFISPNSIYKAKLHNSGSGLSAINSKLDSLISGISNNKSSIKNIEENNLESIENIYKRLDKIDLTLSNFAHSEEASPEEPKKEREKNNDLDEFLLSEKEAYDAEVIDFSWAPGTEYDLEYALEGLSDHLSFDLINSECRTTRCSATVDFESYKLATKNGTQLAEISLPGLNCAKSVRLPIPSDLSARYKADLILDCSQQIRGLVQPDY